MRQNREGYYLERIPWQVVRIHCSLKERKDDHGLRHARRRLPEFMIEAARDSYRRVPRIRKYNIPAYLYGTVRYYVSVRFDF